MPIELGLVSSMTDRTFAFFNTQYLNLVDFNKVLETSVDTVRRSVNGSITFIKWEGDRPLFVDTIPEVLITDYDSALEILKTPDWDILNEAKMPKIGDTEIAILE